MTCVIWIVVLINLKIFAVKSVSRKYVVTNSYLSILYPLVWVGDCYHSAQPSGGGRVLKCSRFVFVFIIFSRCRKWAILRRWLVHVRWFPCSLRDRLFSVRINGEARSIIVLACQVGPGTSRSLR